MSSPDFALVPPRERSAHEDMMASLDRIHAKIDALLAERAHIVDVLRTFYRSDISISSLTPVLDLCVELGAVTKPEPR